MRRFWMAVLGYFVVTMGFAAIWHLVWFKEAYHSLGIYDRPAPIIPLGFLSTILQGAVLAVLYQRYYRGGSALKEGVTFGLLVGAFAYSFSTLALGAKAMVGSMGLWLGVQTAFHVIHGVLAGAAIGLIHGGKTDGV